MCIHCFNANLPLELGHVKQNWNLHRSNTSKDYNLLRKVIMINLTQDSSQMLAPEWDSHNGRIRISISLIQWLNRYAWFLINSRTKLQQQWLVNIKYTLENVYMISANQKFWFSLNFCNFLCIGLFFKPRVRYAYNKQELYNDNFFPAIWLTIIRMEWPKLSYIYNPNKCVLCSYREISTGRFVYW